MTVSIIIPTIFSNQAMLDRCIELCQQTTPPDTQIIVVDGGSFARNCNEGANHAEGEILVFLNDDTEPQPGWLEPLLGPLTDGTAAVTGSRLTYPDGTVQHAGIRFSFEDGIFTGHNIHDDLPSRDVEAVTGACMAIRRDFFASLGGFDENYDNGAEDCDLCLRVTESGGVIRYVAESTVIHHESQSGPARWRSVVQNVQLLHERWSGRFSDIAS